MHRKKQKRVRWDHLLVWFVAIVLTTAAVYMLLRVISVDETKEVVQRIETEVRQTETEKQDINAVPEPEIDRQHLTVNEYSRPGEQTDAVEYIVIHYLGNPKTSAQENRDYFESLKDSGDVSMSANFVVGIDGEIIECVPPGEIAYASNEMNSKSISIENCHLDDTGRFTEDTYKACVELAAWLAEEYDIDREHIIRHYDVTGKACPLYYVEHEDKWEKLRDDIMEYRETCRNAEGR